MTVFHDEMDGRYGDLVVIQMMIRLDDDDDVGSDFGVDLGNHGHELVEADGAVSVLVGEVDHLVNLSAGEVLANAGSDLLELLGAEGSTVGGVEGLEDALEGGLAAVVSAEAEDLEEGGEVDLASVSRVVDDGQDLASLRLHVQSADGVHELVSRHVAAAIVIKHVKDFLQLADSVGVEALLHILVGIKALGGGGGRGGLGHKIFLIQQKIKVRWI